MARLLQDALMCARAANEQTKEALDRIHELEIVNSKLTSQNTALRAAIRRHYPLIAGHAMALDEADDPATSVWLEVASEFAAIISPTHLPER